MASRGEPTGCSLANGSVPPTCHQLSFIWVVLPHVLRAAQYFATTSLLWRPSSAGALFPLLLVYPQHCKKKTRKITEREPVTVYGIVYP